MSGCATTSFNRDLEIQHRVGSFQSNGCTFMEQVGDHQSLRSECTEFLLVDRNRIIDIGVGKHFGIDYVILNLGSKRCSTVSHTLYHPPMNQPNGLQTTKYERSFDVGECAEVKGNFKEAFIWYIEKDWEAVKGDWIFKVSIDGVELVSEKFIAN